MALLSDTYLSQCYASHIQSINAETASALVSLLTPLLAAVDVHQIAHHFTQEAMRIFELQLIHHVSSRTHHSATCTLVFRIDSFFHRSPPASTASVAMMEECAAASSAAAAHTLYVYNDRTRNLTKSIFHEGTQLLTKDEETALLQILHQPGGYLRHFEDYLTTAFPSVRIQAKIVKDAPVYLQSQPFLYYGDPWTSHIPFWHLDMVLELPVITSSILRSVQDTSVVIGRAEEDEEGDATN